MGNLIDPSAGAGRWVLKAADVALSAVDPLLRRGLTERG
jgi:hypothetical protein